MRSPSCCLTGVPGKESAFCAPTTNCLVSLTVQPPFVLTLEDVERVHFERVDFALRNFDMVFIPKDYTKPVVDIKTIEMKALEGIKDWLAQCELIHTERSDNLNWKKVQENSVSTRLSACGMSSAALSVVFTAKQWSHFREQYALVSSRCCYYNTYYNGGVHFCIAFLGSEVVLEYRDMCRSIEHPI